MLIRHYAYAHASAILRRIVYAATANRAVLPEVGARGGAHGPTRGSHG